MSVALLPSELELMELELMMVFGHRRENSFLFGEDTVCEAGYNLIMVSLSAGNEYCYNRHTYSTKPYTQSKMCIRGWMVRAYGPLENMIHHWLLEHLE